MGKPCECSRARVFTRSPLAQDIRAPRRRSRSTRQTDGRRSETKKKPNRRTDRQTDRRTGSSALSSCQPRSRRQKGKLSASRFLLCYRHFKSDGRPSCGDADPTAHLSGIWHRGSAKKKRKISHGRCLSSAVAAGIRTAAAFMGRQREKNGFQILGEGSR